MIKLYNTLSRKEEVFEPIKKGEVKIYSCGPTVYNFAHIGNLRAALFVDFLKRMFRFNEFNVIDVINITDVGHLVSDEDNGEDKMLKASIRENKNPYDIAKFYEETYISNLKDLNIILPKFMPKATDHIKEQLKFIYELDKNGFVYTTSDGVYFNVSKLKDYGKLSGQKLKDKKVGARVKNDTEKKNPQDFALWKFLTGDNLNHIMKWDSKYGVGFPGWHIECSAMGHKYLGSKFDIHTGGIDHIPIHHENEIAQNEGSKFIKEIHFWMHNGFMTVNDEKMAKSLGNVYLLSDLVSKGYDPLAFRLICLKSHYRKPMNFSFESLESGSVEVKKINEFYNRIKNLSPTSKVNVFSSSFFNLKEFTNAINNDLNTSVALAVISDFMTEVNKVSSYSKEDLKLIIEFMDKTNLVLGLIREEKVPKNIVELAKNREIARQKGDFKEADSLRDKIRDLGYIVRDDKNSKVGFIIDKL